MNKKLLTLAVLLSFGLMVSCGEADEQSAGEESTTPATEEIVTEEMPAEAPAENATEAASPTSEPAASQPATQPKAATNTEIKATTPAASDEAVPAKEEGKKSVLRKAADAAQASE